MLAKPFRIPINTLTRGGEKEVSYEEAIVIYHSLKKVRNPDVANIESTSLYKNLSSITKEDIENVYKRYGSQGLFNLMLLARSNSIEYFTHIFRLTRDNIAFLNAFDKPDISQLMKESPALVFDNKKLIASPDLNKFDHNVINPEASWKIFSPGSKPGYVVYGLGGPRILVSHPFKGRGKLSYAVYENSIDVVTSLNQRGYYGTFLFLDNIAGLEYDIHGIPAWLAWFSYIASLSDLVLFVKEHDGDFGPSQQMEIDFTPDRVNKKIIEVPSEELQWATDSKEDIQVISIGPKGILENDEFDNMVRDMTHAKGFVEMYAECGFPKDRIIRILENGSIEEYSIDYTGYAF